LIKYPYPSETNPGYVVCAKWVDAIGKIISIRGITQSHRFPHHKYVVEYDNGSISLNDNVELV